ncbi:periplasmic heavy metal sensor [Lichenicoccus sp.]|uniref:periplasmic heavy metal sensor n=1 Tax=Lichenicoccus sp. TaxID=2781899 RepID=UPI003D0BEFC2
MTRQRLAVLLAVSLFANVFALGAIGGGLAVLSRQDVWRPYARMSHGPLRMAGQGLPAADRHRFRQTLRQVLQDNRDLSRTARASRFEAARLFVQPHFDRDAVNAALARARDADFALRTRLEGVAVEFAATLPAGERAVLARGLEHGGPLRHPARATGSPPAAVQR